VCGRASSTSYNSVRPEPPLTFLVFFQVLAVLVAVYFLTRAVAILARREHVWASTIAPLTLIAASVAVVVRSPAGRLLLLSTLVTFVVSIAVDRVRGLSPRASRDRVLLVAGVAVNALVFAIARTQMDGRAFMVSGVPIVTCLSVALLIDVFTGQAAVNNVLTAALHLVQFPVLHAGPIVRYQDFRHSYLDFERHLGLGAFVYGARRVTIGLVKILLIADWLADPADRIFALPARNLSAPTAWLAAVCVALEIYFRFSGYADIAVGVGRMFGLRYPENFRRPYTATSVREFWRRWNITAITWLRDYLSLPIAGRDAPTPQLFLNTALGFCLVGLWHGGGSNVVAWAIYSSAWLAVEAVGFGHRLDRWPTPARHVYVLMVAVVGWVILRADTSGHALVMLRALVTRTGPAAIPIARFMTTELAVVLIVAIAGAGPLVPQISRWRVALDALAASIVMMVAVVPLFIWHALVLVFDPRGPARRDKAKRKVDPM
jgi:D-alanyl-lipoteichoic acid acyltransferase DltB (MBOAT superfamily)